MSKKKTGTTHTEDNAKNLNSTPASSNGAPESKDDKHLTNQKDSINEEPAKEQQQTQEQLIETLQKEINEAKDKYIRLSAEFDNYRKRTLKEKTDLIKYGSEDILKSILPIVDDFERAIRSTENSTDIEAVKQGLVLIHLKVRDFLKEKGVNEIEAIGLELDTDMHEAITKTPVRDDAQKGKIIDVVEKGYKLYDKVIRFAKVVIGE